MHAGSIRGTATFEPTAACGINVSAFAISGSLFEGFLLSGRCHVPERSGVSFGRGLGTGSDCPIVCPAVSVFLNPAPRVAF